MQTKQQEQNKTEKSEEKRREDEKQTRGKRVTDEKKTRLGVEMFLAPSVEKAAVTERLREKVKKKKKERVGVIVSELHHLSAVRQRQVHAYLLAHLDEYSFPSQPQPAMTLDTMCDNYSPLTYMHKRMEEFMCTMPGSEEELKKLEEVCAVYIPEFIEKKTEEREEGKDELMDEIEGVNFPLAPPHVEERTGAFVAEKMAALQKVVADQTHLNSKQKQQLLDVLTRYEERFSLRGENMGVAKGVEHEIETEGRPFRQRLRTYSSAIQAIINQEVKKLIDLGVIVPSRSPYASNLLLVRKPDASSATGMKERVCVDFVQLNKHTVKDSYPLPNIQSIFANIGQSRWFTTMDLLNGFWQVMVKPEHRHKTAFLTSRGLYEWVVMPFGLCNAPSTFQRLMDVIIKPEYRDFIETYIDDLMTHSPDFDSHMRHLTRLLQSLEDNKLTVKLSKCKFAQLEVKFLGHIISHKQVKMNPESVKAILQWQRPKSGANGVKAVRGFLGMVGWYRKFIKNFAHIAKPLFNLTKKDVKWEWTDECERAFMKLRDAITTYPVLRAPDPNKDFILQTDASDDALGAVLMQKDDEGELHPVAYASKSLDKAQRNYSVTDREALAIVWALEHFNSFCEGHRYTAVTDHAALKYMLTAQHKTPRMHRMVLRLQPYELKLHYGPGAQNHAADLLSRSSTYMDSKHDDNNQIDRAHINSVSTRRRQRRRTVGEYEVEHIVSRRLIPGRAGEYEYEVKWKGWPSSDNTWEPIAHLSNATAKLVEFERSLQENQNRQQQQEEQEEDVASIEADASVSDEHASDLTPNTCDICGVVCANGAALHVHRYHHHQVPVPLSSMPDVGEEVHPMLLASMQRSESEFRVVYDSNLGTDNLNDINLTHTERRFMSDYEFVMDSQGLLYCIDAPSTRAKSRVRTHLRLCLPKTLRRKVMKAAHESVLSAHPGVQRMYDKLRESVWWPRMLQDVITYVRGCKVCAINKGVKDKVPVQEMSVPKGPWTHVGVDHVGPLPRTQRGNEYILVAKCGFIKYAEAWAVPDAGAVTASSALVSGLVCRHGVPLVLMSDRGAAFVSMLAGQVYKALGIRQAKTTAYHPQSNGGVESFNKSLKATLKLWANEQQDDWDVLLPFALFAYNTQVHSLLRETPFYLCHGRDARLPVDVVTGRRPEPSVDVGAYATEVAQRLHDTHTRVTEILKQVNEERRSVNGGEQWLQLSVGDEVYLHDPTTEVGKSRKLTRRWTGPYTVLEKKSEVNYVITRGGNNQLVHVERLKRRPGVSEEEEWREELLVANQELQAITEAQEQLLLKQKQVREERDKLEAKVQIENEEEERIHYSSLILMDKNININWL